MIRPSARSSSLAHVLVLLLAGSALACSRGKSAEDRQLDELRDEISRVQSESDKFEDRLDKLEVDSADVRGSDAPGRIDPPAPSGLPARSLSAPSAIATPRLRVVHLDSDGTEETGSAGETAGAVSGPEADGTRIRITGNGNATTISDRTGLRREGASGASSTSFTNANLGPSLAAHAASRPSALDEDAKHAYDAALLLVHNKSYGAALDALAGFLVRWPDHPNADNAMYWRGECYFAQGVYDDAAKEFEGLLARFPMGNKAADALLKLGISEQHLDDPDRARQRFDRLRREFPHSDAARHIPAGAETVRTGNSSSPSSRSTSGEKQ